MNSDSFVPYFEGAFKAAIGACFIRGRVPEHQIDFVKEVVLRYREAEIDNLTLPPVDKERLKHQWKERLEATANGIKSELRAEGKLI